MHKYLGLLLTLALLMGAAGAAQAGGLTDLDGHWSEQAVMADQSRGIISGYPDGTFRPDRTVTRAELTRMLLTTINFGYQRSAVDAVYSDFQDVPYRHWAKNDIVLAQETGLVTGYGPAVFGPNDPVERQQLAALLVRVLRLLGEADMAAAELNFSDADRISPWAAEYVRQAVAGGLLQGYPDGRFAPRAHTTRAEAASILYRLLKYTGGAFDYSGRLADTSGRIMYIARGEERVAFSIYNDAVLYNEGDALSGYKDLGQYLNRQISVSVNAYGDVLYAELGGDMTIPEVAVGLRESFGRLVSRSHIPEHQGMGLSLTEAAEAETANEAKSSLDVTKSVMNVGGLTEETGADGSGQVIAIIDTGVDVSHPDLRFLPDGGSKIINWVDFTDEGSVILGGTVPAGDAFKAGGIEYSAAGVPSRAGSYRYGFFKENELGFDLNFSGGTAEQYLVLATDSRYAGVFDTVYVDTDADGDLAEEPGLAVYQQKQQSASFVSRQEEHRFTFVVSELNSDGSQVRLGFDANGHGTHIAGIAAANGAFTGVAPGARLMVIKAINSNGQVDWDKLQQAVTYAAVGGADVINLSLGYYQDVTAGGSELAAVINKLSAEEGVVFTIASGNRGPGMGSMASPGNAQNAVSVGAYTSPSMWETDFRWQVRQGGLWYFSSVGPRKDGMLMPTVVAPGSATSTAPGWAGREYLLLEGTSMAAPHVAGVVALLQDAAERVGIKATPAMLKMALSQGAQRISHLNYIEAGNGLIDAAAAWHFLRQAAEPAEIEAYTFNDVYGSGGGLYARDFVPGTISYSLFNREERARRLQWTATADWLQPMLTQTAIPAQGSRELPVRYLIPEQEGLYTGLLIGDDQDTYGQDLRLLSTVVRPYRLSGDDVLELSGKLGAGQYKRYFIRIPAGITGLSAALEVPKEQGVYQGRARIHLVTPTGQEVVMTGYAGNAPEGYESVSVVNAMEEQPLPGVWEIVVYSSATLSLYDQEQSSYHLSVELDGSETVPAEGQQPAIIVGVTPGLKAQGSTGFAALTLMDYQTKQPFSGIVEVNGLLYNVRDGRLTVKYNGGKIRVNF